MRNSKKGLEPLSISILILVGIIFISGIIYFLSGESIESKCQKYDIYQNFSNNYSFGKNKDQSFFGVLNSECDLITNKESYIYYEKYFIGKYVVLVEKTHRNQIESISNSIDMVVAIVEDAIPKTNNTKLILFRTKLVSELQKSNEITEEATKTKKIIDSYRELYDVSLQANQDQNLEKQELNEIKLKSGEFIYITLKQSGMLEEFEKSDFFKGELGFGLKYMKWSFGVIKFVFRVDLEKKLYASFFERMMFDLPITYFYEEMKESN
jgi:hypothetical protein